MTTELQQTELQQTELERQLSLFQLFRKLYEHHRSVLDEILQLENLNQESLTGVKPYYIQGVVEASGVYLITNLSEKKTERLEQPQGIWTIGQDCNSGIHIADQYLSQRHAAIQYIDNQGFYLIDFNSANGSFVNGEPVYQPLKLKDGDRIRLGNLTVDFFVNHTSRYLPTVAVELLMQLVPHMNKPSVKMLDSCHDLQEYPSQEIKDSLEAIRESGLVDYLGYQHGSFTAEEKSEILDRLFNKQTSYYH